MKYFLSLLIFLLTQAHAQKPNIVLIFVDDLGYGDLACYGNEKVKTPHIDQLAMEGQRWTNFYASGQACVPSRRGLMTGRHPLLLPKGNVMKELENTRASFLPMMLKQKGYTNAIIGKWHLANYPEDYPNHPLNPLNCGFDFLYGTKGSNDVPAPEGTLQNRELFDKSNPTTFDIALFNNNEVISRPVDQTTLTSRYTKEAIEWIHKNKHQPFFLYLAHNMPHAPIFASEKFKGKSEAGLFGDVVEEIDDSVGQVMQTLKDLELDKNTLVIFSSDNGPWEVFGPHGGTTGVLRGEKGTSWEGGYRVPGIFWWPKKIKPKVIHDIGANCDLYSTFANLVGGKQPSELKGYISKNLGLTLFHEKASPRHSWLFTHGFRSGDYKFVTHSTFPTDPDYRWKKQTKPIKHSPPLLFNLNDDPAESKNLNQQYPELLMKLEKEREEFLKQ